MAYLFLSSLKKQTTQLAKKVEHEKIVLATLPNVSVTILELVREHGRITIGDAIKLTGKSRNTLKEHFKRLVTRGYLKKQTNAVFSQQMKTSGTTMYSQLYLLQ